MYANRQMIDTAVVTALESGWNGNPSAALVTAAVTALVRSVATARGTPWARRLAITGGSKNTAVGQRRNASKADTTPAATASTMTLRCSAIRGSGERFAMSRARCGHATPIVPNTSQKARPWGPLRSVTAKSTSAMT